MLNPRSNHSPERRTEEDRFWFYVNPPNERGCMEWAGTRRAHGYGVGRLNKKTEAAHRIAWILENGPIPDGLVVCHRCDNPPCVNIHHLFVGTHQDNSDDMVKKGRAPYARRMSLPCLSPFDIYCDPCLESAVKRWGMKV